MALSIHAPFDFKIYSSVVNICKKFNIKSIYDYEKEAFNTLLRSSGGRMNNLLGQDGI